jgi:hypothetical protein
MVTGSGIVEIQALVSPFGLVPQRLPVSSLSELHVFCVPIERCAGAQNPKTNPKNYPGSVEIARFFATNPKEDRIVVIDNVFAARRFLEGQGLACFMG